MFDRFTQPARRVLIHAQEAAVEFQHAMLGTEHLVLGILEEDGPARSALEERGIDGERVRAYLAGLTRDKLRGAAPQFAAETKKTMEGSLREALALGHNHIGPEHLLLGLLRAKQSEAIDMMRACGSEASQVRLTLLAMMSGKTQREISPAAEHVEPRARELAGKSLLTTQHYLLALLAERESLAARVLAALGVTKDKVAEKAEEIGTAGTTDEAPKRQRPATVELAPGVVLKADDAAKLTALDIEELKRKLSGGS